MSLKTFLLMRAPTYFRASELVTSRAHPRYELFSNACLSAALRGLDGQVLRTLREFPSDYGAGGEVDGCGLRLLEWGVVGVG